LHPRPVKVHAVFEAAPARLSGLLSKDCSAERLGIEPSGPLRVLRFSKPLHYHPARAPLTSLYSSVDGGRRRHRTPYLSVTTVFKTVWGADPSTAQHQRWYHAFAGVTFSFLSTTSTMVSLALRGLRRSISISVDTRISASFQAIKKPRFLGASFRLVWCLGLHPDTFHAHDPLPGEGMT
jgi:hypothetical protein